jgi:5-methylcytosine-specific restriction protein A
LRLDATSLAIEVSKRGGLQVRPCDAPPGVVADVTLGSVDPPSERGLYLCVSIALGHVRVRVIPGIFAQGLLTAVARELPSSGAPLLAVARHLVSEGFVVSIGERHVALSDTSLPDGQVLPLGVDLPYAEMQGGDSDRLQAIISTALKALETALIVVPHAVTGAEGEVEGERREHLSTRIERSRANRAACLAIHGLDCAACGMRMSDCYGEVARGLVEVHHLQSLASLEAPTRVDPRSDLVPLCPNCHRVAHLASPPFSPAQIRELVHSRGGSRGAG